ncbi:CaiB/BaiF CoA transferase family protein [Chloroflexota bacterium]
MPLKGIRVIEWTVFLQGPVACQILGSLGAEVIKVEEPGKGDPMRGSKKQHGVSQVLPDGSSAHFVCQNRNKKGIAVDLKKPQGRDIIYQLVEKADVFVQNQRKGVAEKLGLDYGALSRVNPKIIYGEGSGFGSKGSDSELPVLDTLAQARAGMLLYGAESDTAAEPAPVEPVGTLADDAGAVALAFGIVAALLARERLGIGQKVESSLLGSAMGVIRQQIAGYYTTGIIMPRRKREEAANPIYNGYRCKDGRWLRLAFVQSDRYWSEFCKAVDMPELEQNPKFSDSSKREENREELISILDRIFSTATYEEWDRRFRDSALLLYGPVRSIPNLDHDPQVIENRYLVDFDDPVLGVTKVPGLPFDFSETPWAVRQSAPQLGQHTEEVLLEVLGYSWEQIAELKEEGVIG